jgi:hypothetical protein
MLALRIRFAAGIVAALVVVCWPPLAHAKGGHGHGHARGGGHAHGLKHAGSHGGKSRHSRGGLYSHFFWSDEYGAFRSYGYGSIEDEAVPFGDERRLRPLTGSRAFAWAGPAAIARLCQEEATGAPDETVTRIADTVKPNEAQRRLLEEMRSAMAQAARLLRDSCPADLPPAPIARLGVMRGEIDGMLRALEILRPALQRFEQSLSEQQRAQFAAAKAQASRQAQPQSGGGAICQAAAEVTRLPIDGIAKAVRPTAAQREALIRASEDLAEASDMLDADCQQALADSTPLARLQSMETHLQAAGKAVETVRLAIADFYAGLSDKQKARFDQMNAREAMRRNFD